MRSTETHEACFVGLLRPSFERNTHLAIQTFDRPRYSIEQSVGLKIQRLVPLRILTASGGGDALYPVWIVPLWVPILLLAILPIMAMARRKKVPPGFCRRCGYDLRATTGICPECGQSASPDFPAPLPPLQPPTKL